MIMKPFFQKFMLLSHITFSVGWFGAVAGFLALSIAGLISKDNQIIRSAYISMELIGWFVIVPFNFGSLLTGIVQSLGTRWGLFRHYWVLVKFLLTVIATIILLLHMQPISYIADIASKTILSDSELRGLRIRLLADAGAALLVLLVATTISIYKPWGRTPYGLRKQIEQHKNIPIPEESTIRKPWKLYVMLVLIFLVVLLFVILHLTGGLDGH